MILLEPFPYDKWSFGSRALMNTLSDDEYNSLMQKRIVRQYRKGECIFQQGQPVNGVYLVKSGTVKKCKNAGGGKEQVLYIATAGELLGYHTLYSGKPYPDSAIAMERAEILFIPIGAFKSTASQSIAFEHAYTEMLGEELAVFGNFASLGKSGHSEASLARTLVVLAYKRSYGQLGENLEVSISRKDLSNLIDIAEENISRFLSAFKAEGLISTKGSRITLLNVNELIALANEPLLE